MNNANNSKVENDVEADRNDGTYSQQSTFRKYKNTMNVPTNRVVPPNNQSNVQDDISIDDREEADIEETQPDENEEFVTEEFEGNISEMDEIGYLISSLKKQSVSNKDLLKKNAELVIEC